MSLSTIAPRSRRVVTSYARSPRIVTIDAPEFHRRRPADDADAAILLFPGERIVQGSQAILRHRLRTPGCQLQIPVHYPALPELGLDLIGLEPRAYGQPPHRAEIATGIRIAAASEQARAIASALRDNTAPWAGLSVALAESLVDLPSATDRLRRLWRCETTPAPLRSLILRNLVVLLIKQGSADKARELLDLGMKAYPEYAELRFISAVEWLRNRKYTAALNDAKRATAMAPSALWIGSGGESTYRAAWIMGVCSAVAGRQEMALNYFLGGVCARPAFAPAVDALLDLRIPSRTVDRLSLELRGLVRREPQYLRMVAEYLLLHRCFDAVRAMIETNPMPAAMRDALAARVASAEAPFVAGGAEQGDGVVIQAPFFQQSSLGGIAKALARGLSDVELCLEPHGFATEAVREIPGGESIAQAMLRHPSKLGLTIRMCWPPDFSRPSCGKLCVIFPWEFRGVPRHWIRQMRENVDEVWTPSRWIAGELERAGLERSRVRVIPNGIDPQVFTPQGPAIQNDEARGCVFLFVGGAIPRKGFDLLLNAYEEAFTSRDDVTLWIKECGSASFYAHNSLLGLTRRFAPGSRLPHLMLNTEPVDAPTLAALYRRADCLVHPYRGEGFGMPLAEAMACGTPVITTAEGPAPEFCCEETGWLIPAVPAAVPDDPPPVGELSEPLTWFEPRFDELVRAMRAIYENRQEAQRRGAEAARRIHHTHAWPRIMERYAHAVQELTAAPVTV